MHYFTIILVTLLTMYTIQVIQCWLTILLQLSISKDRRTSCVNKVTIAFPSVSKRIQIAKKLTRLPDFFSQQQRGLLSCNRPFLSMKFQELAQRSEITSETSFLLNNVIRRKCVQFYCAVVVDDHLASTLMFSCCCES